MLYGMGTLVLKGPKQRSSDPETGTAAAGSILALKATLVAAEVNREKYFHIMKVTLKTLKSFTKSKKTCTIC